MALVNSLNTVKQPVSRFPARQLLSDIKMKEKSRFSTFDFHTQSGFDPYCILCNVFLLFIQFLHLQQFCSVMELFPPDSALLYLQR